MSLKLINSIVHVLLIILAISYLNSAISYSQSANSASLSPGFFPMILSIVLLVLCLVSIIQNLTKKYSARLYFPRIKLILGTIGILAVYFLSWEHFGYFYIQTFILLFLLFFLYNPSKRKDRRGLLINGLLSLIITGSIYAIFDLLISIRL